ncbi:MAG TPA: hypothetical protein VGP07_11390, partial [Polyangia bacterium]
METAFDEDGIVTFTGKFGRARAAKLVAVTIAALSGGSAHAAQLATKLDYSAAPGCPGAREFEAVVSERLGYNPFLIDATGRIIVRIDPLGKTLEGRLEWRDATGGWLGEQKLPSRTGDCTELARAMGFALAVQLQMMAALAAQPRSPPA